MAAIWTTTDRDNVKAAILALATGAKTVTLGDKSMTYENLSALRSLLRDINADIEFNATTGGFANKIQFDRPA